MEITPPEIVLKGGGNPENPLLAVETSHEKLTDTIGRICHHYHGKAGDCECSYIRKAIPIQIKAVRPNQASRASLTSWHSRWEGSSYLAFIDPVGRPSNKEANRLHVKVSHGQALLRKASLKGQPGGKLPN